MKDPALVTIKGVTVQLKNAEVLAAIISTKGKKLAKAEPAPEAAPAVCAKAGEMNMGNLSARGPSGP